MLYLDLEAQGRGSTFTFCHAHLKKVILLHKMAKVPFDLLIAVHTFPEYILVKMLKYVRKSDAGKMPCRIFS